MCHHPQAGLRPYLSMDMWTTPSALRRGSCATRVSTLATGPAALPENHMRHEGLEELRGQSTKAPFTGGGRWKGRVGGRSDILTIQIGGVGPRFSLCFP